MKKRKFFSKQIKKTLPYQLLVFSLVVLVVLILIWVISFVLGRISYFPKDKGLEGELGTLKWDLGEDVVLDVLNYNISANNQTIDVNINWSVGSNEDLRAILFNFSGPVECNYTNISLPNFWENKTYSIDYGGTSCGLNFENITNVFVYAQINIPLVQTSLIQNITLYNDDNRINMFDLDDYFNCLENISFSSIEDPNNDYTLLKINSTTNLVTLIKDSAWYGIQKFNLTASCDGEVLDISTNGNNMSFYIIAIDSDRVIPNNAPEFLDEECGEIEWNKNTNYEIDVNDCFDDEDDDDLEFRYSNSSGYNDYLIVDLDNDDLTLIPDDNWTGRGYFYIYANDSIEETSDRINFEVLNVSTTSTTTSFGSSSSTSNVLKIKSSSPSSSNIDVFINKTQKISITADNYVSIKWYLDGKLIREGGLSYNFKEVNEGDYIVKVEVINGTVTDSKTWNVVVQEEDIEGEPLELGPVIFYLIVGIILVVIFLFLWLFIAEKNSKKKKINYMGFGISSVRKRQN